MRDFPDPECTPAAGVQKDDLESLFEAVRVHQQAEEKRENEQAAQIAELMGHNGGPKIEEPFGLRAPWLGHLTEQELARLAVLEVRIERLKRILQDPMCERRKMMKCAIRRMRRANGKN